MTQRLKLALPLLLLAVACVVKEKYVVLSDVPANPTVTVIPASAAREDVSDADVVMGLVVGCGVRTVIRPVMMKERTEFQGTGSSSGIGVVGGKVAVAMGDAAEKGGLATSVDEVSLLSETKADYVIYVRHKPGTPQLVIVRRDDGQVIHAGQLGSDEEGASGGCCLTGAAYQEQVATPQVQMRKLLVATGILK